MNHLSNVRQINNNNNNNNKVLKTVIAGVAKEDEHLMPKKCPKWHAQYIASDSPVQLLAFTWQDRFEQIGVGQKASIWRLPYNHCSV